LIRAFLSKNEQLEVSVDGIGPLFRFVMDEDEDYVTVTMSDIQMELPEAYIALIPKGE
jgi:hypothetical protein